jgi:hypothetical protein
MAIAYALWSASQGELLLAVNQSQKLHGRRFLPPPVPVRDTGHFGCPYCKENSGNSHIHGFNSGSIACELRTLAGFNFLPILLLPFLIEHLAC